MSLAVTLLLFPSYVKASPGDIWVIGADSPVTDDSSHQQHSIVSGDTAVWTDCRPDGWNCRLFHKDLTSVGPEQELVAGSRGQDYAAIDGDLVVWEQLVYPSSGGNGYQVYYQYLGAWGPHPVSPVSDHQCNPSVSGSLVVWEDERAGSKETDIYMCDIATGVESPISTESSKQLSPDIDGEWVIWVDNRGGTYKYGTATRNDIYAKNVATGEERRITFDESNVIQGNPAISRGAGGYRAVYEGDGIWLYDFQNGQAVKLASEGTQPDIDGDIIVWRSANPSGLFMHDLSTLETQVVSDGQAGVFHPSVSGNRIVWGDERNGNRDIFQNRLEDSARTLAERYKPLLHFSHDIYNPDRTDFEPRTVELMVDIPGTRLITSGGDIEDPGLEDLPPNNGPDSSIDLPGSPAIPFSDFYDDYLGHLEANPGSYPVTTYARVVPRSAGSGKTVVQYWFCYYFNDWHNNHEGDWEMVQVILNGELKPEAVAYSQHGDAMTKNWDEAGLEKDGDHPRVYIAQGSHANYFRPGADLRTANMWGLADRSRNETSIYPALEMDWPADSQGWAAFAGRWGERSKWWWPPYVEPGPPGPVFQGLPWDDPLAWAGSAGEVGYLNSLVLSVSQPADIHAYDDSGNHTGRDSSGAIDTGIPASEYFERNGGLTKNIVIQGADIQSGFSLVIEGVEDGMADIDLRMPDFGSNAVYQNRYLAVPLSPAGEAEIIIDESGGLILALDTDGDGITEEHREADEAEIIPVDFSPPGRVNDLQAGEVTSATAQLAWTAPGDDGSHGTAARYEVRYATEPIDEHNWPYAAVAGVDSGPQVAGSSEQLLIEGLEAGTTYYFAVNSRDDAWQSSAMSNVASVTTSEPELSWAREDTYWKSLADYQHRLLNVDYRLSNIGSGSAYNIMIEAASCSPTFVSLFTQLPKKAGDLPPGTNSLVSLSYSVPIGIEAFITRTYASCRDDAGREHRFPDPLPGQAP